LFVLCKLLVSLLTVHLLLQNMSKKSSVAEALGKHLADLMPSAPKLVPTPEAPVSRKRAAVAVSDAPLPVPKKVQTHVSVSKKSGKRSGAAAAPAPAPAPAPVSVAAAAAAEPAPMRISKKKQVENSLDKIKARLAGSRFRWLNEVMYTVGSDDAAAMFKEEPHLMQVVRISTHQKTIGSVTDVFHFSTTKDSARKLRTGRRTRSAS
jgi:hypothetical protein